MGSIRAVLYRPFSLELRLYFSAEQLLHAAPPPGNCSTDFALLFVLKAIFVVCLGVAIEICLRVAIVICLKAGFFGEVVVYPL